MVLTAVSKNKYPTSMLIFTSTSAGLPAARWATGWSWMKGQQPSGGRKSRPMMSLGQGKHDSSSTNPPEQWRKRPLTLLLYGLHSRHFMINGGEDFL
jgi:hypothetical protein